MKTEKSVGQGSVRDRIVSQIVQRPILALVLGAICVALCLPGGQHLKPDFSYRVWFDDHDPLLVEFDAFEKRFGNDEAAIIIVHSPSGVFDIESSLLLYEMTERLWRVSDVIRVDSLANYNWVHDVEGDMEVEPLLPEDDLEPYLYRPRKEGSKRAALKDIPEDDRAAIEEALAERRSVAINHETLPNYLVSKDGNTALIMASLKPAIGGATDYEPVMKELRALVQNIENKGDHEFHIVGGPAVSLAFKEAAASDFSTLLPIVFGLALVFLIVFFRRVSGVVLPVVIVAGTIMMAMTTGGWLGFSINNMTMVVPQILLAIAIADSVHVLQTYYRTLAAVGDRREAARYALEKNFVPTLLTSVSTAIGFFSFATAEVETIAMLGIMAGIGTLYAWLLTYLWLGPLMVLLPIKVKGEATGQAVDHISRRGAGATDWLARARRPILIGALLIAAGAIVTATKTQVNSDPFSYFPEEGDLNKARVFLEENIGGAITMEVSVYADEEGGIKDPAFMNRVDQFQQWLAGREYVTNTVSLVDILKSTNRSLHNEDQAMYKLPDTREGIAQQYLLYTMSLPQGMDINDRVTVKQDALRISSSWTLRDSKTFIKEIDRVIDVAKKDYGLNVSLTGKTQLWQRMNPKVVNSFVTSVTLAVVLMTILMIVVFRSVGLGLLAMVPNGLPLLVGAAFLVLIGKTLDIGTVIVFSVCLGIAVDDTVHFLANYNVLRTKGKSARDAIATILTHTAPALVITTVVLVAAFGTFAFAQFVPNRLFGIMVAFILSVALITDLVLLPALLLLRDGKKPAAS